MNNMATDIIFFAKSNHHFYSFIFHFFGPKYSLRKGIHKCKTCFSKKYHSLLGLHCWFLGLRFLPQHGTSKNHPFLEVLVKLCFWKDYIQKKKERVLYRTWDSLTCGNSSTPEWIKKHLNPQAPSLSIGWSSFSLSFICYWLIMVILLVSLLQWILRPSNIVQLLLRIIILY